MMSALLPSELPPKELACVFSVSLQETAGFSSKMHHLTYCLLNISEFHTKRHLYMKSSVFSRSLAIQLAISKFTLLRRESFLFLLECTYTANFCSL